MTVDWCGFSFTTSNDGVKVGLFFIGINVVGGTDGVCDGGNDAIVDGSVVGNKYGTSECCNSKPCTFKSKLGDIVSLLLLLILSC